MLTLTRKADYALVAMAQLAKRAPGRISARDIAERVKIPLPVLTNILHQLLHSGLVSSVKGSKGGYRLARDPNHITLAEMIDAIEGPFKLAVCCSSGGVDVSQSCELEDSCDIKEPVQRVHTSLRHFLNQITLTHIAFTEVPVSLGISVGQPPTDPSPAEVNGHEMINEIDSNG